MAEAKDASKNGSEERNESVYSPLQPAIKSANEDTLHDLIKTVQRLREKYFSDD